MRKPHPDGAPLQPAFVCGGEDILFCGGCEFVVGLSVNRLDFTGKLIECPQCGCLNAVL